VYCSAIQAQQRRSFTVADDVGFTHFVSSADSYSKWGAEGIQFSPNGDFVLALTARGRPDLKQVEESLRFYRTRELEAFLNRTEQSEPPSPIWSVRRFGKEEPIERLSWLPDSSGVALLEHVDDVKDQIVLVYLGKRTTDVLTDQVAVYSNFGVRDRNHYVYVAEDEGARKRLEEQRESERRAPVTVFTGNDAWDYLMPNNPGVERRQLEGMRHLWAVVNGRRFEVKHNGAPLDVSAFDFSGTLSISPDGQSIVTRMRVKNISPAWEKSYLPPYPSAPDNNIHAGGSASEFVQINLDSGAIKPLLDAPPSGEAGWNSYDYGAAWSSDGKAIVLSGTFLPPENGAPSPPCVAVVYVALHASSCVEQYKGRKGPGLEPEAGYHYIMDARFAAGDKNRVVINFGDSSELAGTIEYQRTSNGEWQVVDELKGMHHVGRNGIEIAVKEGLNQPPVLVASKGENTRVVLDPNPQFKSVDLGQAKVFIWKDEKGREWEGGLYLPEGFQKDRRYPLVIQTHGFSESVFRPSGSFPTAFAARELAVAGIAVLQIGGSKNCPSSGPDEASCAVAGYEAAARQLAADGVADLQNVGYIGFSHTCWYGMEILTNGSLPLKTALLADGVQASYFEFVLDGIDFKDEIGAKPFGAGLETWIKRSPGFHVDRIKAPLLIAVEKDAAISMWQPYAGLRYLKKPVELDLVNTDEHVITNPVERMASQGLSVDWFRFWLQGYEDPDPAKLDQYKRWRGLREMQEENEKKAGAQSGAN